MNEREREGKRERERERERERMIEKSIQIARFNHDRGQILARIDRNLP